MIAKVTNLPKTLNDKLPKEVDGFAELHEKKKNHIVLHIKNYKPAYPLRPGAL